MYLRSLHRTWLSRIYLSNLEKYPELYERLKFKFLASEIFKGIHIFIKTKENTMFFGKCKQKVFVQCLGKKSMYPESLKHDYNGNRDGILQQLKNIVLDKKNPNTKYLVSFSQRLFSDLFYNLTIFLYIL